MNLLELRKKMKSRKPTFIRQQGGLKKAILKKGWKKPVGRHSKMRTSQKGHPKKVSIGYASPKAVLGLHQSGLKPILITNINDLNKIKKDEGIILSGKLGIKKKLEIIKKIQELKLNLLDIKPEDYIKKIQEKLEKKKEAKKGTISKEKPKEEITKKPKEEQEETPEEKEKRIKEEKRKLLEKRQ